MIYQVVFAPEALEHLAELDRYIALAASPESAAGYTDAIVSYCEGFSTFPHRGTTRDEIRTGLRITNYKKRAVIAFAIDEQCVSILGVFYGGQDYETILQDDPEEGHKH